MKKPVAVLLAALLGAVAAPAYADELGDAYAQVLADPGNTQVNLRYAALAEKAGKPRLALAAYERILLNDPDNSEAQAGIKRIERALQPNTTRFVASLGAGWESNPANINDHEKSSPIILASGAMRDNSSWGSTAWQTDALGVLDVVTDESELDYGFLGAETGPVWDTNSWFTVHPAIGAGISYFDHTTFYSEATASMTLEGVAGGADQVGRIKVGYRDYSNHFDISSGWYIHVNGRWSFPHIFNADDVFIVSPWFRWSAISGGVPVSLSEQDEPGRYTEFGADFAYYVPLSDRFVFGANITVSDRNYRDPGLDSGTSDRHDTMWAPGATLIFKHIFWYQSDLRFNYTYRNDDSNDKTRNFNDNIFTVNIDTRF